MEVNRLKKMLMAAGILAALSFGAYAAEIDLEGAQRMAEKNNPDVMKSETEYDNSVLVKKQALKYILPTVSWTGLAAKTDKNVSTTILGTDITTWGSIKVKPVETREIEDTDRLFSNTITVTQPIYYAGKEWAGLRMAQISNKISKVNLDQKKSDIRMAVTEEYMNLLKAKKSREILERSITEIKNTYSKMEEMYNLKMITKSALLDMKARMIELESNMISLDMAVELAEMNLKSRIGISLDEKLVIRDVEINTSSYGAINIAEDVEKNLSKKSVFKVLEYSKLLKQSDKRLAMSNILPQIGFRFEYTMKGTELQNSVDPDKSSWNAGLSINMNLWDWGLTFDKMAEKDNDLKKMEIEKKNTRNSLEMAARKYYYDVERLRKLIEAKSEALAGAQELYGIEKEKFDLKMSTTTDFLSAENALRKAETELVNTKIEYFVAHKKYYNFIEREAE